MSSASFLGFLSNLIANGDLKLLHERLITLFDESYRYTCEETTAVCCEILQDNARVQAKLFRLLNLCSEEGGLYGGIEPLKKKLLPWLASAGSFGKSDSEDVKNVRERYERTVVMLEEDLKSAQREVAELRLKLTDSEDEIKRLTMKIADKAKNDLMYSQLEKKLTSTSLDLAAKEKEMKVVKEESDQLKLENSNLHSRLQKQLILDAQPEPLRIVTKPFLNSTPRPPHERAVKLIERFAELYGSDRLELMDGLRGLGERDTNERLVFCIVEECFMVCKAEQRRMRKKVQQALQPTNGTVMDQQQTDDIIDSYMARNTDNYDVETLIPEVIKCLHRNPTINQNIPYNEKIIVPFLRQCLQVIWSLVSLKPQIEIAIALDGDTINETRYRRAYNSEFSATVVHHFVWPALMREGKVVAKGEVVTRRIKATKEYHGSSRPQSAEIPSNSFASSYDLGIASMSSSWSESSAYKRFTP
ncbi:mitochondria-eating protein isoform X2 [Exaiptasia diaphana]|uniref:Mitochondria-eating protein n=1 Tax=Exaiptasia diaphana TaxID=2652724 RepID=A0A913XFS2_EXADI|nr:mitochondria-eating protein isoform X2 [Exaiptasia diaphana]